MANEPTKNTSHSMPNTAKQYKPGTSSASHAAVPGKGNKNTGTGAMSKSAGAAASKRGGPKG